MADLTGAAHAPALDTFEFYASCPMGFEDALAGELRRLGLSRVRPLKGRVSFGGTALDGERACLWSRLASRVFVVIGRFDAVDADELYEGVYRIPWERVLRRGATIAVSARGTTPELRNTHFTALRVKDALCDRLADEAGSRASVDLERPDARIAVSLNRQRVGVSLDLSGDPLFRRMPRASTAPGAQAHVLRPDYAALLLEQVRWADACRTDSAAPADGGSRQPAALIDACCAGGGAVLEAAQMLLDRAPGLSRRHWGFQGWAEHDPDAWHQMAQEAQARADEAEADPRGGIVALGATGADATYAERVLRSAGVAQAVRFAVVGSAEADRAIAQVTGSERKGDEDGAGDAPAAPRRAIIADALELPGADIQPLAARIMRLRALPALADAQVAVIAPNELIVRAMGMRPTALAEIKPGNEDAVLLCWHATADRRVAAGAAGAAGAADPHATARLPRPAGHDAPTAAAARPNAMPSAQPAAPSTAITPALAAPEAEPRRRPVGARRGSGAAAQIAPAAAVDLGRGKPVPVLLAESEQFANRLKKNARLRRKWARREDVTCYRAYDADLPDYAAAIDLYEGSPATPGRWLVIAEYAAPKTVDAELARARILDILAIAPVVLEVDPAHVYARSRTRSRGGSQYGRRTGAAPAAAPDRPLIEEGGLTFEVSFDSYLDTGIFLDHRVTRGLVRDRVRARPDCRFLNLFAYTGTATCYAADGGAAETVTVDLSNTYLDWTERNLERNGFTGPEHHIVRADVLAWIEDMRRAGYAWDVIFCDPPTFSNSAKMGERTWDVQRDHVRLLTGLADLLTPDGEAIFSCNLRGFRPDLRALSAAGIDLTDITEQTIPEDFARNRKIHHCYELRRAR